MWTNEKRGKTRAMKNPSDVLGNDEREEKRQARQQENSSTVVKGKTGGCQTAYDKPKR